jgi:GNAT superfamily N-acetyltransferase
VQVQEIPGLGHLPYAEVWFHEVDDERWREASDGARGIGKSGLEVWTTTKTQQVADFFASREYEEVRRYAISELDVASARDLGAPELEIVAFADRPELADELYAIARTAYPDQFGREGTYIGEEWYEWGLRAHPPESYLIALEDGRALGYGYLEHEGDEWRVGFMAIAREARGRGVAGAIKRAQTAWAKEHGLTSLRTANEVRLVGLIDLNRRIGYRPLYEEIVLRGPLAPES